MLETQWVYKASVYSKNASPGRRLVSLGAALLFGVFLRFVLTTAGAGPLESGVKSPQSGEALAHIYCASCHAFPAPDLLDKKTWKEQTLPRMSIRLGLAPEEIERHPEASLLKATGVFPAVPMISEADWKAIVNYYLQAAPEKPLPQGPRAEIAVGLDLF